MGGAERIGAPKVNFVHLNGSLPTEKLLSIDKNQPAPQATRNTQYILGVNHHQGKKSNVGLTTQARLRHVHIIGATGTGKSTLLTNLIVQNILNGNSGGLANAGTQIIFRLGRNDSTVFQQGLEHFEAEDLQKLSIGEAVIKVGASDQDCIIKTSLPDPVAQAIAKNRYETARYISNLIFGTSIESLEAIIAKEYIRPIKKEKTESELKPEPKKPKPRTEPEKEIPDSEPQKPITPDKPSAPPRAPVTTSKKENPPIPADFDKKAKELLKRKAKEKEKTDHRALQKAIKRLGDGMNYRSTIEAPTPDGKGRVDVLLEKDRKTIACEVAMTTNNKHEVQNIRKCLKAGYSIVAMICENPKRLQNIKALSQKTFSQSELKKVWFVNQAGFTQALAEVARQSNSTEQTIKGYRVKTNYIPVKGKDANEMQRRLTEIVMKRKKKESIP